jgi:hypothetical protein
MKVKIPKLMKSGEVKNIRKCHAELDSASHKIKTPRDPETSSG